MIMLRKNRIAVLHTGNHGNGIRDHFTIPVDHVILLRTVLPVKITDIVQGQIQVIVPAVKLSVTGEGFNSHLL